MLKLDDKYLRILEGSSKIGVRGKCGYISNSEDKDAERCDKCGILVSTKYMQQHIENLCMFLPMICDLCSEYVSERQFLSFHKISSCKMVKSCDECLEYYSIKDKKNHQCINNNILLLTSSDMPLLRLKEDKTISLQIGRVILISENKLDLSLFKKVGLSDPRNIDESIEIAFPIPELLSGYKLILHYHKTMLGCGDSVCLKWYLFKGTGNKFKHQSIPFKDTVSLIEGTKLGIRLIRSDRELYVNPYS